MRLSEYRAHYSVWAVLASPLVLGAGTAATAITLTLTLTLTPTLTLTLTPTLTLIPTPTLPLALTPTLTLTKARPVSAISAAAAARDFLNMSNTVTGRRIPFETVSYIVVEL